VSTWASSVDDHCLAITAHPYCALPQLSLGAIIVGLGVVRGSLLALSLTTIGMCSSDALVAASLSGMLPGVGYAMAALGPAAAGLPHARGGGWNEVPRLFAGIGAASAICGLGAGRPQTIGAPSVPDPA